MGLSLDLKAFPNDRLDRVVVVAGPGFGKSALLTSIAGKLVEGPFDTGIAAARVARFS